MRLRMSSGKEELPRLEIMFLFSFPPPFPLTAVRTHTMCSPDLPGKEIYSIYKFKSKHADKKGSKKCSVTYHISFSFI